jgi:hypothetical protein
MAGSDMEDVFPDESGCDLAEPAISNEIKNTIRHMR